MTPIPKGAKKIRTVTICGVKVPVYRVTAGLVPDMGDDFGRSDFQRMCIFILAGQHETQERDTLVHECVHMFLVQSGIRSMLEAHHGKRDGFEEFEESIVRVATPHLVGYLKGLR